MLAFIHSAPSTVERIRTPLTLRKNGKPSTNHWAVGRNIKIDKRIVDSIKAGIHRPEFKIKSRFIVRGHFRHQACGEGHSQHKYMWINPYWKGPKDGAEIVHTYKPKLPPNPDPQL